MTVDITEINDLFLDYANGFDDFDADAITDCFAYPTVIWQLGKGNMFQDRDELAENVGALLRVFEQEEIVHSEFEILSHSECGPTALATLSWRQERANGEVAMAFICHYALMRHQDELLIATVFNEE